ncbi:MAG TPA: methyltransferase domain-containing protein [Burkholderiaceae bacterium]|nr:methyltransferase domain-containing protein [Burkholderiaceae bacterium]
MPQRRLSDWDAWLASPPGQYMLHWEQAQFDRTVADIFGYHALQLGMPGIDALRENRIPFAAQLLDESTSPNGNAISGARDVVGTTRQIVHCRFDELPFAAQSVDLVAMPHVLEFSNDAHEVLREVSRILMPEGQVVLTGFNPYSLWGMRQGMRRLGARPFMPRDGQFIGFQRLKDWLKLLGFEIIRGRFGCYAPPNRTDRWLQRTAFMDKAGDRWWPIFGAIYSITAVKRVRAVRMVGPAFQNTHAGALGPVTAPASPSSSHSTRPASKDASTSTAPFLSSTPKD